MEQHSHDVSSASSGRKAWTVGEAQAYQALCSFGSWALLTDVQEADIARLAQSRTLFSEPPFSQVASDAAGELQAWLAGADAFDASDVVGADADASCVSDAADADVVSDGARELAREAHLDRSYLFYMVGQSRTSPYESVYRTDDATLFGPTTFQVRERYAECGLAFEGAAKEPDDHLGLELAFLAHLLECAAGGPVGEGDGEEGGECADRGGEGAKTAEDTSRIDGPTNAAIASDSQLRALEQARSFLSEHVLVFAPLYLSNVRERARSPFYRAIAAIVAATIESLAAALGARAVETVDEARFSLRG